MGLNIVMGRCGIHQGEQDQATNFGNSRQAHDPDGAFSNIEDTKLQVTSCEQGFERARRQEGRRLSESQAEEGSTLSKESAWKFRS